MVDEFVANDTSLACAQAELDQTPTAVWLDTIAHASNLSWFLNQAAIQAAGETLVIIIVIYDLPGRDCHALASNGEIPAGDLSEYETSYINPIVATLKADLLPNIRVVLIIEPDSLPNGATNLGTQNCTQAVITGYQQGIAYAMASLTMENVWQYMDMGHGGWLGWPSPGLQNIGPLVTATISMTLALNPLFVLRGFITNTANYDPWLGYVRPARDPTQTWMSCNNYPSIAPNGFEWCYAYNAAIDEYIFHTEIIGPTFAALGLPNIWLFDSSRSGQAGVRENWGSWCNIVGAGIGPRPAASPQANDTTLDAFVWIKPPGTSDGNSESLPTHPAVDGFCDCTTTNGVDSLCPAPQAGFPFPAHFTMLVQNANPQLGTCSF
jgi:cellulose 1,4-beta-cellobiosidase